MALSPSFSDISLTPNGETSANKSNKGDSKKEVRMAAGMQGYPQGGAPMGGYPVQMQPMGGGFGAPVGLNCLAALDHLVVQQQIEMLEVLTGYETANRYCLTTGGNQLVFYAVEQSNPLERQFSGKSRSLCIHVLDITGQEVVRCVRPSLGCCCDDRMMMVECPPGAMVGGVMYRSGCCTTHYEVCDGASQKTLHITKQFGIGGERTFLIRAMNGVTVGSITKKWGGFMKEMMTDADTFIVKWPAEMPVQIKAAVIGATFLIDYQEFENNEGAR